MRVPGTNSDLRLVWKRVFGFLLQISSYSASKTAAVQLLRYLSVWNPSVHVVSGHPVNINTAMSVRANLRGSRKDDGESR